MPRIGRPPTVPSKFDKTQFEKLLALQCTRTECAAWFAIAPCSLDRQISKTYGRGRTFEDIRAPFLELGRARLRTALWQGAIRGNASLIRLLAASQLGIRERIETSEDPEQLEKKMAQQRDLAAAGNTAVALEIERVSAAAILLAVSLDARPRPSLERSSAL